MVAGSKRKSKESEGKAMLQAIVRGLGSMRDDDTAEPAVSLLNADHFGFASFSIPWSKNRFQLPRIEELEEEEEQADDLTKQSSGEVEFNDDTDEDAGGAAPLQGHHDKQDQISRNKKGSRDENEEFEDRCDQGQMSASKAHPQNSKKSVTKITSANASKFLVPRMNVASSAPLARMSSVTSQTSNADGSDALALISAVDALFEKFATDYAKTINTTMEDSLTHVADLLQDFVALQEAEIEPLFREHKRKSDEISEECATANKKIRTSFERHQMAAIALFDSYEKNYSAIQKCRRAFDKDVDDLMRTYQSGTATLNSQLRKEVGNFKKTVGKLGKGDQEMNQIKKSFMSLLGGLVQTYVVASVFAIAFTSLLPFTMTAKYVTIEAKGSFAIVTICREPVNSMNLDLWQQLLDTLTELENDPKIRAAIFQSGLKRDVFTAGNDITELYSPKTNFERYSKFNLVQNQFLARLYRSPLFTVAAVRGACPAGGCVLAMSCDYRVMTEEGSIGLNEVALGISVPLYWIPLMVSLVGQGKADKLMQYAVMLKPAEALKIGLIDEVVKKEDLLAKAEGIVAKVLRLPDEGRWDTKRKLRQELSEKWEAYAMGDEAKVNWDLLTQPSTVKALEGVIQRLSGGKASKM
ncbi:hypothetical protein HK102_007081 [Quaeritorhiza haematococci]|nr:hypothetical protein HK102_007081 [Quaeritorhiza haematococci]